jgi:lysozyme
LICLWEELRLSAYLDTGGVWTIGWGHTASVKQGDTCSELQACNWRREDLEKSELEVNRRTGDLPITQAMFDALVSFEFNTGGLMLANDQPSKVLAALREHRWADAGEEMIR